jgi:hypothetical protein
MRDWIFFMCEKCRGPVREDRFDYETNLCPDCRRTKPLPERGTNNPTWAKPTDREIANERRRFLRETRRRFSRSNQSRIWRAIVRAFYERPDDESARDEYAWLVRTYPRCQELCATCQPHWLPKKHARDWFMISLDDRNGVHRVINWGFVEIEHEAHP